MSADELAGIEQRLEVRLPPEYRAALLAYPFPAGSAAEDLWLLNDARALLALNQECRRDGFFGRPWPSDRFVIGSDGGGNLYFLDLSRRPAPVLEADHETGALMQRAPDVPSWVEVLRRDLAEIAEDERYLDNVRRQKHWWQFWIR